MKQYIIVDTKNCELSFYQDNQLLKRISPISIGRNGTTNDKVEGDGKTPLGTYSLGTAFGTAPLQINYPYRQITPHSRWIDDPTSKYYNKWVEELDVEKDWQSAEILIEHPISYELGIVIDYNKECIPNKGSAIFLHITKNNPTAGCIAISKNDMLYILNNLNPSSNPTIEIK